MDRMRHIARLVVVVAALPVGTLAFLTAGAFILASQPKRAAQLLLPSRAA